ncbi:WXG100 family type VII secretion target [Dactylosporangium sp. CA-233914]|uniref:WXG100 family type VII secretion target n=1 Tax=Dactylosporangium sp. CA-233914 TaxID=3239934 RepID=UPI003D929B52
MADIESSQLRVPASLAEAGPFLSGVGEILVGELTTLQGKLAPLGDVWQGDTQLAYQEYQAMWNAAADGLFGEQGVLTAIAHAVNVNYENYAETETVNGNAWKH